MVRSCPAGAVLQAAMLCSCLIATIAFAEQLAAPPAAMASATPQGDPKLFAFKKAVREIAILQERIVRGEAKAAALLTDRVKAAGGMARDLPSKAWEMAEARLLLLQLILSGGETVLLRQIAERKLVPEAEKPIYFGALAYAEGHQKSALTWLAKADLASLPRSVLARVLLARAVLVKRESPTEASELCAQAWAISAGTYAEEIATRLSTQLSADAGDPVAFWQQFRRYARRFPQSPYMASIVPVISKMMIKAGYGDGTSRAAEMEALLERLPPVRRYELLREIALNSIRDGKPKTAAAAAEHGLILRNLQPSQVSELQVLLGAALTVAGDLTAAKAALDDAERHGVMAELSALVAASRALGRQIGRPIPTDEQTLAVATRGDLKAAQTAGQQTHRIRSTAASAEHEQRMADAKSVLVSVDRILREASE